MATTINTETIVGAAVVAVAAGFLIFAVSTTGGKSGGFGDGYTLSAEFDNVEGVNVGTDVRLAGVKIGTVVGQALNKESFQARIDMIIDKSVVLADDTSATITNEGLLGGRFVSLSPGGSDTKLADGGFIGYTQGTVDMWSLISQAMFDRNSTTKPKPDQIPDENSAPQ